MKKYYNLFLASVFLLPLYNITYIYFFITILFFIKTRFIRFDKNLLKVSFFFIVGLSLLFMNPYYYSFISINDFAKSLLLIFFVLIVGTYEKIEIYKYVPVIILFLIIASQLSYVFNLTYLTDYIDEIYPFNEENKIWTHRSIINLNELFNTNIRAGGIYRNPNQYTKYINLLYILILNTQLKINKKIIISIIIFCSILLTGSRSGLAIYLIINFLFLKENFKLMKIYFYVFLTSITVLSFDIETLRSFSFLDFGSLSKRFPVIKIITENLTLKSFLVGNFYGQETISSIRNYSFMFDSDLLSTFFRYGFLGTSILFSIYYKISEKSHFIYISTILMYAITSGVFNDISFFILITMIVLLTKPNIVNEN
jgi:hypothetical protein